jgi:hypothetical protein
MAARDAAQLEAAEALGISVGESIARSARSRKIARRRHPRAQLTVVWGDPPLVETGAAPRSSTTGPATIGQLLGGMELTPGRATLAEGIRVGVDAVPNGGGA